VARQAIDILNRAKSLLYDAGFVTWSQDELFDWANDGIRDICVLKPDAKTVTSILQLSEGSWQTLEFPGVYRSLGQIQFLVEVIRNMGTDGITPGRAVSFVDRREVDASSQSWMSATPDSTVVEYSYDKQVSIDKFQVYPPQPATGCGHLEAIVSVIPPEMFKAASPDEYNVDIPIGDEYFNALLEYVLARAFSKDADSSQFAAERSDTHTKLYMANLGKHQ
jgi:hypothetical protein